MPRIGALDKFLGLRDLVAHLHMQGLTVREVRDGLAASEYPVDPGHTTVEEWLRDEGVKRRHRDLALERMIFVSNRVDAAIWDRLEHGADMLTTDELLAIRKAFLPYVETFDEDARLTRGRLTEELFGRIGDDPDMAAKLKRASDN